MDNNSFAAPAQYNDPIAQAQREAAEYASPDQGPQALKLDIRNAPIAEEGPAADAAYTNLASTLKAVSPHGRLHKFFTDLSQQAMPQRRTSTLRGRRDVRNTVYVPSTTEHVESPSVYSTPTATSQAPVPSPPVAFQSMPSQPSPTTASEGFATQMERAPQLGTTTQLPIATQPGNSIQMPGSSQIGMTPLQSMLSSHRQAGSADTGSSDTQSIRSGRSLGTGGATTMHPEMHAPGLNFSLIETVSASIDHGQVTRSTVIGELALLHNRAHHTDGISSHITETIRLDNFPTLEKVAPNPAFVTQLQDRPGEYSVDVSSMNNNATIAFKYQLHLDDSLYSRQAPLLLTPSWKVEPTQTSVILTYTLNPAFSTITTQLHNVALVIYLDSNPTNPASGRAISCQSKPAGTFSRDKNTIHWRLDDLTLTPGAPSQKLLARFTTDGEARAGRVEARWEITASDSSHQLGSGLGVSRADASTAADPFADEGRTGSHGSWVAVPSARRLVSGTYVAT